MINIIFQGESNIVSPKKARDNYERSVNARDELHFVIDGVRPEDYMSEARKMAHAEHDGWLVLDWICFRQLEGGDFAWKVLA